jgi:hypothetical protein
MSKLAKAIDATFTGNVRASRDLKLNYLDIKMDSRLDPQMLSKEIKLSAKLETTKWIEDTLADNPDIYREVCRDIKRSMIEEVFGEFRPMLIEMRSALYDARNSRVRTLLAEMENIMFHEGL